MYKGKRLEQSSIIHKSLSSATLIQTTNHVIEREIDNYTRLLEQDKRKFFRVQQNRNEVIKQYSKKNQELDLLKSRQFQAQTVKLKSDVKILERELEQTINSYNQILATNKRLKTDIDELRKQKLNQKQVVNKLTSRIQDYRTVITSTKEEIESKKDSIELSKQQILKIKAKNEEEAKMFREEISDVRGNLGLGLGGTHMFKRKSEAEQKNEATDTQPLLRYRLKNLLAKNKQRVKIIQSYRKTMQSIWKSFQEIKQESGVNDLDQITSTFLKHEQQNHFIYEYIDKLSRDSEEINDNIEALKHKIAEQKQTNQEYIKQAGSTDQKQRMKLLQKQIQEDCKQKISNLQQFIGIAQKALKQIGSDVELTKFNLAQELAKIEQVIDTHYASPNEATAIIKEEVTRYTKIPPGLDELKENKEEKLLEGDKLREFASEFWEKRKGKVQTK